jgi:hypothetical protein
MRMTPTSWWRSEMGKGQDLEQILDELAEREVTCQITTNGGLSVYPRSRIPKSLLKRVRRHKRDIIALLRAAGSLEEPGEGKVGLWVCRGCEEIIAHDEPHISFEQVDIGEEDAPRFEKSGKQQPYHADLGCRESAMEFMASKAATGEVWMLHLVHACGDAESGYACKGGCFA